jgi:RimJ/RimL family protein N-acetyltransferase
MTVLRTPRLLLRRWREADIDQLSAINADPEVMRFIGDGSVRDRERTAADIKAYELLWEREGFGRFAVELAETGELTGFAGMAVPHDVPDIMPAVEIGWRFARAHWGRGIATEAARAALGHAFDQGGLDRVVAIHIIGNIASERVMQKLGMRPVLDTIETVYRRPVRVHAIRRARRR